MANRYMKICPALLISRERPTDTGMRYPLILIRMAIIILSVVSDSLQPHGLKPIRLLCPWNSLGKNTGVGIAIPFSKGSS